MTRTSTVVGLALAGSLIQLATSQPKAASGAKTPPGLVVAAEHHDTSARLADMPPAAPQATDREGREPRHFRRANRGRKLPFDPIVQDSPSVPLMPSLAQSFEGVNNVNGVLPPDSNGDVGPNHYVQWVNLSFAVYSKGTATTPPTLLYGPAAGNTLWTGFGGPCETTNNGDPIVIYDHLADRWVMSQLALPNNFIGILFAPFYQCLAISATPDPLGPYYRYSFKFNKLNDYPKLGLWSDAYYMTMNQFTAISLQYAGQGVVAFERDKMLLGQAARMVYFDLASVDMNLGGMLPSDLDGPAPPANSPNYFVQVDDDAWGYAPADQLQIWQFHVDWNNPSASSFSGPALLPTSPFDSNLCNYSRNCIPQPGTTARLDTLADRLMYRLQYRNFGTYETLVVNHSVDVNGADHAGVRWYEIRNPGNGPSIYQQGTYAPDANHRWMGSAAMDGAGNIALGYSVAGRTVWPSIRYTGRLNGDPLGIMTQGEADLIVGTGAQTDASGRWGDYSMMAVDPDNCTFWYTQEYYAATSGAGWRTRIGSFSFPSCTGTPPPPPPPALPSVSVVATTTPAREAGQTSGVFTVTRTGDTAAPMTVQYSVGGTATPGSDYAALPGSLTIPAGASSATIIVAPIDDLLVEPDESVIVTLVSTADYRVGSPGVATVTIVSDDKPPDLVVSSLTAPSNGGAGAALTVNDTTSNQGTGPAPASLTAFYLSLDFTIDSKDILLGTRSVPMLAAGASNSAATTFTVPAGTATGTYWLLATADSGNAVPETSEANNTKAAGPVGIGPDLLVSTMSGPAAAAAGTAIVVTDTTLNQGGAAVDSSRTDFYLSSSGNLDATAVAIGSRLVPALAAGGSSSASTSLTVPGTTAPGTYFVLGKADGAGAIVETNESNNVKNGVVIRIGPDLIVTSVTVPASGGAGGVLAVTDTTKNQGAATAAPSTTFFYLSADVSLDPSDVLLGGRAVPALAPGASDTASTSLPIPASTATGAYFVIAMADGGKVVAESIEINNTSTATVRIGPDLTVPSLSVPAVGGAGSAIVVTDTTMNAGGGAAAGSTTAFYLSTNSIVDSSDILLGTRTIQPLSAGASDSASTTLTIPPSTPTGTYVILALADSANVVVESSEVNNTSAGAIIRIGPDLTVTTVSGPGTASAGSTIVVTDTTQNAGGGAAPASTTQFYLSANLGVDSADFLIGSRAVPPLAAGASDTASTTVTLPAGIAPGYYFILAVSDGPGVIVETSEINNVRAVFNQIVP